MSGSTEYMQLRTGQPPERRPGIPPVTITITADVSRCVASLARLVEVMRKYGPTLQRLADVQAVTIRREGLAYRRRTVARRRRNRRR